MLIIYNMLCQHRTFLEKFMLHVQPGGNVEPLQIIRIIYTRHVPSCSHLSLSIPLQQVAQAWVPFGFFPPQSGGPLAVFDASLPGGNSPPAHVMDQCGITIPSRGTDAYPTWGKGKSSSKMPFYGNMIPRWKNLYTVFIVKICLQSCFFWKNTCTCIYLCVYLSFFRSFYLPGCLPICLSVCLFYPWYDAPWATGFLWLCKVWKHQYLFLWKTQVECSGISVWSTPHPGFQSQMKVYRDSLLKMK